MRCIYCGTENTEGAEPCAGCGRPLRPPERLPAIRRAVPSAAKYAVLFGVLAFCVPIVLSAVAAVFALVALRQIRQSEGRLDGRRLAITALQMAGVSCLAIFPVSVLANRYMQAIEEGKTRNAAATAEAEMRNMAVALESYRVFESRMPSPAEFYDATRRSDPIPAGAIAPPEEPRTLTSPVSHIAALPGDPFRERLYHYGYWTDGKIWLLRAWGPDADADIDLYALGAALHAMEPGKRDPSLWPREFREKIYNPRRDVFSDGDIIRSGP